VPLTSFVGRRREVTDAKRVVSASRLVTLIGPGGVGKTRLALKVAVDVRRAFGDGVWLVELDQLRDPALVSHTVAASLGLREQSGRPPMAVLQEFLVERRLLLVLDNCEHLVVAVAVLADTLLRSCPHLRILATSREPLGIGGEATLPVPSLSVPDPRRRSSPNEQSHCEAVTLFAERAASAVPEFSIAEDNRRAVVEICRRLDGLPLAIELAAVRLRALTAQEIAHRLGDRYRLLTRGPRGAPTRQQTLRSCVQWSYDLCSPQEQLLWARLAVFAGSVELDAAEGVCAGDDLAPENILEVVASLVDKSILIPEQGTVVRYRLLDTIREYGRERLHHTGEYEALRRRHRDWYADFVARADADWVGPRQVDWLTRLDREHPNIRAALEFSLTEPGEAQAALRIATKLFPYWFARGLLSEGRHWLDQALARDTGLTAQRSRALHRASTLAGLQGDLAAASALAEQGRELAAQLGDAAARTQAMLAAGYSGCMRGDPPGAVACFAEVLDTLDVEDDVHWQLEARYGLALASGMLGDTARTVTCHEEILAITEPRGELWYRSHSLWNLGVVAWRQGDPRRAAELVEQSLRLKQAMDDTFGAVLCLDTLAWIAASEHDPRRAATLLGAAAALTQAMGTHTITYTYPGLAAHHEQCEQTLRALGEQAFQTAYQHGMGLAFDDAIAYALKEKPRAEPSPASTETTTLTRRQQEVADLVADGLTNKEIAARLVISPRTAETHVDHILTKLGFTSRTQIAAWAIQQPGKAQDRRP
jgi:non-specific serine/threonine protein kinase